MSLSDLLALGDRELISLVGGGGKSTLLFALGNQLGAAGKRVILTTTTKMGREQADSAAIVCWSADTECATAALDQTSPVMLVTAGDSHKVTGPTREEVDRLYTTAAVDYVIVEADGSRGKPLKAPAAHEPVIPSQSTIVVIMMGIDAVGRPLENVAHRVDVARSFTGLSVDHRMTPADCVDVLLHPEGALRSCPPGSRVIVAIAKVGTDAEWAESRYIRDEVTRRRPDIRTVTIASSS
ncbi:MAG: selenium cofactor biosynthesis protein YqeC [Acidimicrobiia bacterium]|nr:selenium cofactor biosynthesis protein YqeC [Acidimicrobiia bacterium]